jgi:hypothetical protein
MDRRTALLVLVGSIGARVVVAAQAPGGDVLPKPPPDRIRVRYFRIVYERLDQANAEVTAGANERIIGIVNEGAAMVESGGSADAYARGDDGFRIFVDRLVEAGREAANRVRVTGEVVARVRDAICPLFPFC